MTTWSQLVRDHWNDNQRDFALMTKKLSCFSHRKLKSPEDVDRAVSELHRAHGLCRAVQRWKDGKIVHERFIYGN